MTNELEDELRRALRPVDADAGFAQRVMSRIANQPARSWRPLSEHMHWLPAALAATVLLSVFGVHEWQARREQQGLEARRQLIEALRMAGQKLDLAYQAVNEDSPPGADDSTGA